MGIILKVFEREHNTKSYSRTVKPIADRRELNITQYNR